MSRNVIGETLAVGTGDESVAPGPGTIQAPNARGNNVAGADLNIESGTSTGSAGGGGVTFKVTPPGSAGFVQNLKAMIASLRMVGSLVVLALGRGDGTASPGIGVLRGADAAGTDVAGGSLYIDSGRSTGTGGGGVLGLRLARAGTAGATLNPIENIATFGNLAGGPYVQLGRGHGTPTPTFFSLTGADGVGTDVVGGAAIFRAGRGTGAGAGGDFRIQVSLPGESGSVGNATTDALVVSGTTGNTDILRNLSAASMRLGAGDGTAAPGVAILRGANAVGTDIAGGTVYLDGGRGTGAGAGGGFGVRLARAGASGTALNLVESVLYIGNLGGGAYIQLGRGHGTPTPSGVTVTGADSVNDNVAGGALVLRAGRGTGNAPSGDLRIQVGLPGTSGSGGNTPVDVLTISGTTGEVQALRGIAATTLRRRLGAGSVYAPAVVCPYASLAIVGTPASTVPTVLASYTLPAGAVDTDGQVFEVECFGTFASNSSSKTVELMWGDQAIGVVGPTTANGTDWHIRALIMRLTSNTQTLRVWPRSGAAVAVLYNGSGAQDLNAAVAVGVRCTGGGMANDVLSRGLVVRALS